MAQTALDDAIALERVERALVIKLRHHGDVLLTAPVLSALKAAKPHIEIDALVYADTAPMLSLHPALDQLHTIDRAWKKSGLIAQGRAEWALFQALRRRRYDLIVHLTPHPRGAWLTRLLRPRWAVAPRKKGGGPRWANCFTHLYPGELRGRHTVESNLDALRRLGIQPADPARALTMVPGQPATERVAALLAEHGLQPGAYIHLHPASRWTFKCWPVERQAELVRALAWRGERIVLTAAPDAREYAMVHDIVAAAGVSVVDLSGQLSLKELAALTASAKLFIGVDSAPMHIAAAVGTPTVALFGPSGEAHWGPWAVRHEVVSSAHPCRPCGQDGCGGSKISDCLTTLPTRAVQDAIDRVLTRA